MEAEIFASLKERIGERHLGKRLRIQVSYSAKMFFKGMKGQSFHFENSDLVGDIITACLKLSLCYKLGAKNALKYQVRRHDFVIRDLPPAFDGFKIMHLSDIHADGILNQAQDLCTLLQSLEADICVITGDYRFKTHSSYQSTLQVMADILQCIRAPYGKWGVLGNHDFIEFVAPLESEGLSMLLNESVAIEKEGEKIWLAGVDDDHFYQCADLGKTLLGIPPQDIIVLLSHTPELYKRAALDEIDLFLCGHTHAGQICLPGGFPPITNAACSLRYCRGRWQYLEMQGYTSSGTGSSGVPVRFNCAPEIAIHTLKRK
jgi:predicted MPP superfamily phosphohydrolase